MQRMQGDGFFLSQVHLPELGSVCSDKLVHYRSKAVQVSPNAAQIDENNPPFVVISHPNSSVHP
ncbi:hypothetical protein ES703_123014 [subsurface metagenome]